MSSSMVMTGSISRVGSVFAIRWTTRSSSSRDG